jgi:hypothetical protein
VTASLNNPLKMNRIVPLNNFNKFKEFKKPDTGNGTQVKKVILTAKPLLDVVNEGGCDVTCWNIILSLQVASPVDIIMVIVVKCWRYHVTVRR